MDTSDRPEWGGVARRGARVVRIVDRERDRDAVEPRSTGKPTPQAEWVREDGDARSTPPATGRRRRRQSGLDEASIEDVNRTIEPRRRQRVLDRLTEAAAAFSAERYADANRILRALAQEAPDTVSVRELYGLTLYRQGRWRAALHELDAAAESTGTVDQHPVRADARRALGQHAAVDRLWDELRREGVAVEVLTEARIVTAGSRADRGDLPGAIALLEAGLRPVRRPREHHLRLWYALASLYERAGDVPRARALFRQLLDVEPGFADAAERVAALS